MSAWHVANCVDSQPSGRAREEFLKLAQSIREYHPDFNVGDKVRRRLLGGTRVGTVKSFSWLSTHLVVTVACNNYEEETFHPTEYVKA